MISDEVVDVVAVRNGLVATAWAMNVTLGVACTAVGGRADRGVRSADIDDALVDVRVVSVVQVAVVEIVDVVAMANRGVTAGGTVDVRVIGVGGVVHDVLFPFREGGTTT